MCIWTCCGTFCKIKSSLIWYQMKTIARRDVHISGSHFGCITVNLWKRRACYGSKLFRKIFTFVICKIWFVFRKLSRNFADFSDVIRRNFAKGKNCVNYCVLPKSKILLKLFLRGWCYNSLFVKTTYTCRKPHNGGHFEKSVRGWW